MHTHQGAHPESSASIYRQAAVEHVDLGSTRLAFRRFGPPGGEPILLVHGWPLNGFTWRKILPPLVARGYHAVTVDLAGAGDSEWTATNDFSFHGHAAHLQGLVRHLGWDAYRLIAHDTGATVARRLAVLEGARVRQGVYIDTEIPHHRPPLVETFQRLAALPGTARVFGLLLRSRRYLRSGPGFGGCFVDKSLIDGAFTEGFVAPLLGSKKKLDGQMRYVRGIDWKQLDQLAVDHAKIVGSSLLVWGEHDPFFPIDRARAMVPQFKDCRGLVVIPQTKLLPHEERPELVAEHVLAFFGAGARES